jgi:RNA polymerase-binding protein DksA
MNSKPHSITRYNDDDLEAFKEIIENKIKRARGQLEYFEQQLQAMADNPDAKVKGLDDGTGTAESEAISGMALRQQKLLKHLENALIRIQNKTYGICRETGKLISKERLKAVPHATLSIAAKRSR